MGHATLTYSANPLTFLIPDELRQALLQLKVAKAQQF
jgi:hypothetical protein